MRMSLLLLYLQNSRSVPKGPTGRAGRAPETSWEAGGIIEAEDRMSIVEHAAPLDRVEILGSEGDVK